ncbi:MAG: helix-hairpin-helix domain-containing protein [candidate division Zixibacteria bacterium]|nr:helix-hairpin-helix domain-containing protein [candidate division Zixibacteria bacterium]
MPDINRWFDFSQHQLRFLAVLGATAVVLGGYLFLRAYTTPAPDPVSLPIVLADADSRYTGSFVLDPNTAPADSLELLPGVGRVLADRIVAYRQHHVFASEIDITEVKGIGPRLYEKLRPYLRVNQP